MPFFSASASLKLVVISAVRVLDFLSLAVSRLINSALSFASSFKSSFVDSFKEFSSCLASNLNLAAAISF